MSLTFSGPGQAERVKQSWTHNGTTNTNSYTYSLLGLSGFTGTNDGNPTSNAPVTSWFIRDPAGVPIAQRSSNGNEYYYLFDGQGDVVALEDPGTIQAAYDYCPTGNEADQCVGKAAGCAQDAPNWAGGELTDVPNWAAAGANWGRFECTITKVIIHWEGRGAIVVVHFANGNRVDVRRATTVGTEPGNAAILVMFDAEHQELARFRWAEIAGYTIEPEPGPRGRVVG